MREEYTRENYPSFGKKYAGEKAIISLTSWKARIDTVSKTLYSLLKQCPGFHIVLVLSEEEFPKMMDEMPASLKLFVKNNLIEVLWVYKNYKSFKKVLFTMDKYRDVPVISADDDCIYTCNYAEKLYDKWEEDKSKIVAFSAGYFFNKYYIYQGPSTLYPPNKIMMNENLLGSLNRALEVGAQDDYFISVLFKEKPISLRKKPPFVFHDSISPISTKTYNMQDRKKLFALYESCFS